jgi:hypothetical protein
LSTLPQAAPCGNPLKVPHTPSDVPAAEQCLEARIPDTRISLNQLFTGAREKTVLFGFRTATGGKTHMQDRPD